MWKECNSIETAYACQNHQIKNAAVQTPHERMSDNPFEVIIHSHHSFRHALHVPPDAFNSLNVGANQQRENGSGVNRETLSITEMWQG